MDNVQREQELTADRTNTDSTATPLTTGKAPSNSFSSWRLRWGSGAFSPMENPAREWEAKPGMYQRSISTFEESYGCYCLLDMLDSENTAKQNWRAKQPSQMACFLEDLEVLKRWRHQLPAQSRRQFSVDRLEE